MERVTWSFGLVGVVLGRSERWADILLFESHACSVWMVGACESCLAALRLSTAGQKDGLCKNHVNIKNLSIQGTIAQMNWVIEVFFLKVSFVMSSWAGV